MSPHAKLPLARAIVSEGWATYRANAKSFLLYLLPYFLAYSIGLISFITENTVGMIIGVVLFIGAAVYSIWMYIVLTRLLYQSVSGTKHLDPAVATKLVWQRVIPLLGAGIITTALTMLGFFAFIVPALVLAMMYFATAMSVIIDNEGVHEALYHSVRMTAGRKWNLFWTFLWSNVMVGLVYGILVLVFAGGLGALFSLVNDTAAGMAINLGVAIAETLLIPWFMLISVILFRELKKG